MKNKDVENATAINFGALLKEYFEKHRIFRSALGRKINRSDSTIVSYQKRASLQSSIIENLSHALKHNFFADLADLMPDSYTKDLSKIIEKDAKITALETEIMVLKAEKEVLLQVLKK